MRTILEEAAQGRASIVPWTVDQYHRAIASGLLAEDSAFELIDGLIVRKDRATAGDDPEPRPLLWPSISCCRRVTTDDTHPNPR